MKLLACFRRTRGVVDRQMAGNTINSKTFLGVQFDTNTVVGDGGLCGVSVKVFENTYGGHHPVCQAIAAVACKL